jgi:hypothetical protein
MSRDARLARREIKLKPWLYRVARNESVETLRRRREGAELEPEQPGEAGIAERAETRERLRGLLADLGQLPERQRAAPGIASRGADPRTASRPPPRTSRRTPRARLPAPPAARRRTNRRRRSSPLLPRPPNRRRRRLPPPRPRRRPLPRHPNARATKKPWPGRKAPPPQGNEPARPSVQLPPGFGLTEASRGSFSLTKEHRALRRPPESNIVMSKEAG